jgi:8-oxo-dGTP pyrophosphatase MutT (NUDIX family)
MNEEHNPWTILHTQEVYENPWIRITHFDVLNPAGGKGIYGRVHFKNYAIGVIPLDDQLNTYLVGQYRFPLDNYSWEIPEGGGPIGLDLLQSAKRELKEETGLVAEEWTKILHIHLSNSVTDEYGTIFIARHLTQEEAVPEDTEQLTVKKVPFEEAYRMVNEGIITDSITVAAILKVKILLLEGKLQ